jgi:hypothetical protein
MWAYASVSSVSNPGAIREILAPHMIASVKLQDQTIDLLLTLQSLVA